MITDRALTALRCASAVAGAIPSVRLRIDGGGQTLLEVARPPLPERDGHPVMPVCAFRNAVATAHRYRKTGDRLRFMGLDRDCDPAVSYGVRPGLDVVLTGGMLRVRHEDRWLHLLAVASDVAPVAEAVGAPVPAEGFEVDVATHTDDELDISILHVATDVGDHERSVAAIDALTTVASKLSVAELEAYLSPDLGDLVNLADLSSRR